MKVKTKDLIGVALDWAVAKCTEAPIVAHFDGPDSWLDLEVRGEWVPYWPSADWAQGGPIIEQEHIHWGMSSQDGRMNYITSIFSEHNRPLTGPTPLISAMRCLVHAKMGEEIYIPDELQ